MTLRPAVMRRLMKELVQLKNEPPEGIRVVSPEENMLDVTGIIEGPAGTPYEGGYFRIKFSFTDEFPAVPPKCRFATKIFHPNVSSAGEICVNTLKKDWQSSFGVGHILITVKCLLIYPNPESALDEEAGKLLLEDYESYCERARLITSVHASSKARPPEFDDDSTSAEVSVPAISSSASSTSITIASPSLSKSSKIADTNVPIVSSSFDSSAARLPTGALSATLPIAQKSTSSSQNTPQPLQNSASNAISLVTSDSQELLKSSGVTPLGRADANAPALGNTCKTAFDPVKSMKRPATTSSAGEKRKKALKRL